MIENVIGAPFVCLYASMIASLSLLFILELIEALSIEHNAFAISVEYSTISLIDLPVKSLNGLIGSGFFIGSYKQLLSTSNLDNQELFAGSENSPL